MISFSGVSASAKASGVFVEQQPVRGSLGLLRVPQKIALFGQYNAGKSVTDYVPRLLLSPDEAASLYGVGSMLHLMARKAFLGAGSVEVYAVPIPDDSSATAASGSIGVSGSVTAGGVLALFIGGQKVSVKCVLGDSASTVASSIATAIAASVNVPITATPSGASVLITAKWGGETGNQITIRQDLDDSDAIAEPSGISLAISQPTGGATDPVVDSAFDALGATFFTQIAFPYRSAAALASLDAYWLARIAPGTKKPFVALLGYTGLRADYLTHIDARNSAAETYILAEDSPNLELEVAASAVGQCAASAAANPARPWKMLTLLGIRTGDRPALTYTEHDTIQTHGGGTTEAAVDGTLRIRDLVTTYKTNDLGAADDSLSYPETIANIQAKIYSLDTLFKSSPFDRAIVVDDAAVTGVSYAVSPKRVKAYVRQLVDELWIPNAWSKNRDAIMASITAEIDSGNPGRINVQLTDNIAAGLRIVAILFQWAFSA